MALVLGVWQTENSQWLIWVKLLLSPVYAFQVWQVTTTAMHLLTVHKLPIFELFRRSSMKLIIIDVDIPLQKKLAFLLVFKITPRMNLGLPNIFFTLSVFLPFFKPKMFLIYKNNKNIMINVKIEWITWIVSIQIRREMQMWTKTKEKDETWKLCKKAVKLSFEIVNSSN